MFNPKLKEFMEQNPDKTLLGFGWSVYWRFLILVLAIEVSLFVTLGIIMVLLSVFGVK